MILHVGHADKFTTSLWRFLSGRMDLRHHRPLMSRRLLEADEVLPAGFEPHSYWSWILNFIVQGQRADKIILHGLFDPSTTVLLLLQPWLLSKCYWVMWGGDVYFMESRQNRFRTRVHDRLRRLLVPRIGNLLTYIDDDIDYLRAEYGAKGKHHHCLMYPSNTFRVDPERPAVPKERGIRILAGNSASATNNHGRLFEILSELRDGDVEIICPLSYGDEEVRETVRNRGADLFGKRFVALTQFMPVDEYRALLASVQIALFAHTRQEAMGTIIELLGQGKKVFLNADTPQWNLLSSLGISVFDLHNFDISPLEVGICEENRRLVAANFRPDVLERHWTAIFDD